MKKLLLIAICYVLMPSKASAQTYAWDSAISSGTVWTINIASQTSVSVSTAVNTGALAGAHVIEIYNLASNNKTINCSYTSGVSTTSTNNYYGREIPPGVGVQYGILVGKITPFCQTQDTTASTRVTITQIK